MAFDACVAAPAGFPPLAMDAEEEDGLFREYREHRFDYHIYMQTRLRQELKRPPRPQLHKSARAAGVFASA